MQPSLWNVDLCNVGMQQSYILKVRHVIEKSCGPLKCLQRLLMIT